MQSLSEYMLVLALCLVLFVFNRLIERVLFVKSFKDWWKQEKSKTKLEHDFKKVTYCAPAVKTMMGDILQDRHPASR